MISINYLFKEGVKFTIPLGNTPSEGLSDEEKSEVVKKAKDGEDIGKPGKKFDEVADKAAKTYGSEKAGKRVAAAAMWQNIRR